MKLIHKRKNAECPRITRLFGKKKKTRVSYQNFGLYLVQVAGLEPVQYCYHWNLNPARLPIPPYLLNYADFYTVH